MKRAALTALAAAALLSSPACKKEKEGWHCFAFTYQGKRRVHCEENKKACLGRRDEVSNIAKDFTDCKPVEKVHCFDTYQDDNPRVCSPSYELCEYTRELHARALQRRILDYSDCYELVEGERKVEEKAEEPGAGGGSDAGGAGSP